MSTELTTQQSTVVARPSSSLDDLRRSALSLPVEQQQLALTEFSERRKGFRDWLLSQLEPGVHFGYPPGCVPQYDENGDLISGKIRVKKDQWRPKPSLYKAGAEFVCELMGYTVHFEHDKTSWEMLMKPEAVFFLCVLTRSDGVKAGEGRGARFKGQKSGDLNNVIKMAQKCAQVDAVLHALGLSDLFTQDLEDSPAAHPNPVAKRDVPKQQPRTVRVTKEQLAALIAQFKRVHEGAGVDAWAGYVENVTGRSFDNVRMCGEWTTEDLSAVAESLSQDESGEGQDSEGSEDDIPF